MPLLLLLAAASPLALAGPVKPAGQVSVSGVVEVPLYAGLGMHDLGSYVEAKVGDKTLYLRLATGHRELKLTEAALGRIGVKASGKDGEKKAKIDTLELGGAKLTGLTVTVGSAGMSGEIAVDGELGLPGIEGLAYAILPSQGKLKLATGTDGAGLVSGVGTAVPAESKDKAVSKKIGKSKEDVYPVPLYTTVKWSGVDIPTRLVIEGHSSWIAREVEGVSWYNVADAANTAIQLPAAPGYNDAEWRVERREASIAGLTTPVSVERRGVGPVWVFNVNAGLGGDVLVGMDLAVDPSTRTLAVKVAGETKKASYDAVYEARLREALEPKPGKDGAAPDEDAKKAARKAGLAPLAAFLLSEGRIDEGVAAYKELADAADGDCAPLAKYGSALVSAGQGAEAVAPLTQAAELYAPWAALPLAEREKISKDHAAAEKKKEEWTGQRPQSHACHVAPGMLALAQLQAGNAAAVATLYPAQLDLDENLPLVAGTSALLQQQYDAAQAAYRQALKLRGGNFEEARVGLYLAMAPTNYEAAREQLERLRLRVGRHTDPLLARLYIEGARARGGASAVRAALDDLLAADPGEGLLLALRSRERAQAGDPAGAAQDWSAARSTFEAQLASKPNDGGLWASWAAALTAAGELDAARKAADTAVKLAPRSAAAWLALSDVQQAAGDAAGARSSAARAGSMGSENPAYALLLAR
jgi:Flp pilus assembly protein TadD